MAENHNRKKTSGKKKAKQKVKFNFGVLIMIFILSYLGCFLLFMTAANLNDDFFKDEFTNNIKITEEEPTTEQIQQETVQEDIEQPTEKVKVNNPVPQSQTQDKAYLE
ncbi:MAG: hypothetical protein IJM19_00400, partial [Ruminococcus sp.]|nr:hypothetical protein [Ruminococcus sp.]